MKDKVAEAEALRFFEAVGGTAVRISEVPGERRADFRVKMDDCRFIAEVKGKSDDEEYRRDLELHGEADRVDQMTRTNPVSRQIRKGFDQLRNTPASPDEFRTLILVTSDDAAEVDVEQFKSTLYGSVDIVTPGPGPEAIARPCLYFTYSEFYGASDIDTAIILIGGGSYLCLNEFGNRIAALRETRLYHAHAKGGALLDPERFVAEGHGYEAIGALPRNDPRAMLSHVKAKYGLAVAFDVRFQQVAAAVAVPQKTPKPDREPPAQFGS